MKEQFKTIKFSTASRALLDDIHTILERYDDPLTLRQLYYQLVSRDIIPNNDKSYKKISGLLTNARMAGVIDWNAIEDRVRVPQLPYYVNNIPDALDDTLRQYRLDRMDTQDVYIEVWIEKDALSNIVGNITREFHIRLMVNRGYSSCSAMYEAAERFNYASKDRNIILYFGDHDPSGLDMIRDIQNRMEEFQVKVEVVPVALTMAQIRQYNPPPNPAKLTDSRSGEYTAKHGFSSWELDALDPDVLKDLVRNSVMDHLDYDKWREQVRKEQEDKETVRKFIATLDE